MIRRENEMVESDNPRKPPRVFEILAQIEDRAQAAAAREVAETHNPKTKKKQSLNHTLQKLKVEKDILDILSSDEKDGQTAMQVYYTVKQRGALIDRSGVSTMLRRLYETGSVMRAKKIDGSHDPPRKVFFYWKSEYPPNNVVNDDAVHKLVRTSITEDHERISHNTRLDPTRIKRQQQYFMGLMRDMGWFSVPDIYMRSRNRDIDVNRSTVGNWVYSLYSGGYLDRRDAAQGGRNKYEYKLKTGTQEANSIQPFVNERLTLKSSEQSVTQPKLWYEYRKYCDDFGLELQPKYSFMKEIGVLHGVHLRRVKVDGRTQRTWIGLKYNPEPPVRTLAEQQIKYPMKETRYVVEEMCVIQSAPLEKTNADIERENEEIKKRIFELEKQIEGLNEQEELKRREVLLKEQIELRNTMEILEKKVEQTMRKIELEDVQLKRDILK